VRSGLGTSGIGTAWFSWGAKAVPIRIGDKEYKKGLGALTTGDILVELDGQYDTFEAEVGIQQPETGSVVFEVLLDGKKVFDSGVVKPEDPPRPISVPVRGAREMRLLVNCAAPPPSFISADWADARLIRAVGLVPSPAGMKVNIAPFARVVTCDPHRYDGAKSGRLEEFRAEDIFLETDLAPDSDGIYKVPATTDGLACMGLVWTSRRRIRELALQFTAAAGVPSPDQVDLQCWVRSAPWPTESAWQGSWKPLKGTVTQDGNRLVWKDLLDNPNGLIGTQKVRWIFHTHGNPVSVGKFVAFTASEWDTTEVSLQLETPQPGKQGRIDAYNGEISGPDGSATLSCMWDLSMPIRVKVRYSKPDFWKADRTVLRLRLPSGAFGLAVDDVLANEYVYVKDYGFFATRGGAKLGLAEYKQQIANRRTIMEEVRQMPDQTREQAMEKTRAVIHNREPGPTLLSLPGENHKFVIQRDGVMRATLPDSEFPPKYYLDVAPKFGSGEVAAYSRSLRGGWLPIQEISWRDGGKVYRQLTFVAPFGRDGMPEGNPWMNRRPLFVAEMILENPEEKEADETLALALTGRLDGGRALEVRQTPQGIVVIDGERMLALVGVPNSSPLRAVIVGTTLVLRGELPASSRAGCTLFIPGWNARLEDAASMADEDGLLRETESYWRGIMSKATQIDIPDAFLKNLIMASQVHCLMASRNEENGSRIAPWVGATDYPPLDSEAHAVIEGLDLFGHHDYARRALDFFIHNYNPRGYLSRGYTLIGTGWHLLTVAEHFGLTGDSAWFNQIAPKIAGVCQWVTDQREKTKSLTPGGAKVPEYGLMPPGVVADWEAYGYMFAGSGFFYVGLHEAALALASIGYPGAQEFLNNADDFRSEILRAYHRVQSQAPVLPLRDGTWVPGYPMQVSYPGLITDFFPDDTMYLTRLYDSEAAGANHLVPQGVLDAKSRETEWMMNHMEDVQFLIPPPVDPSNRPQEALLRDWFDLGGYGTMQAAYCANMEIDALRDDVKPFIRSYFNAMAGTVNIENLSFSENTYSFSSMNKTHTTGEFLRRTRFMFVNDEGDGLRLAPFLTSNWMKDGMTVGVTHAPTKFGDVSYRIESHVGQGFITARIEPPARRSPAELVIRLRHPDGAQMRKVTVDGVAHEDFDADKEIVGIKHWNRAITIRADY
jgi:hypothetical protein